ncbi:MAG: hypothetical protein FWF94_06765 [Oscillospiraceae bacterium]|nr:hypothetical protein [Oscillospiraceae bacterium]
MKQKFIHPLKKEWLILAAITSVLFCSHLYWDIIITTRHGINVWTSLFEGRLFNFYFDNANPQITGFATSPAIYPFTVYIIFAVWNFPLWVLERFFGFDPFTSTTALMYAKSILIPFLLSCAFMVYKICLKLEITKDNAILCAFFFASSVSAFFAIAVTGQYDIFCLLFILLGLYSYIKKDYTKFLLFFAVAITLKLFALFIFIPLILLFEKRLHMIIVYFLGGLSFYLLLGAIFSVPEGSSSIMTGMVGYLFSHTLELTYIKTPIFVIMTVLLWIFCYIQNTEDDVFHIQKYEALTVYVSFASMAILFVCCYTHLYWIILMSPFMCILAFTNTRHIKAVFLIESLSCGAMVFALNIVGSPVFAMYTINSAFLSKLFGKVSSEAHIGSILANVIDEKTLGFVAPSCTAAFVAGIIAFSFLTFPLSRVQKNEPTDNAQPHITRSFIWGRTALNAFICGCPILCYFYILFSNGS